MKRILSLGALALAFSASTASADPLMKYDYFDAAYQWTSTDSDFIDNQNGLDTKISYSPIDNFAIEGGYNYARADITGTDIGSNSNSYTYGVLGYYSICPGFDLLGRVGGTHLNESFDGHLIDIDNFSFDVLGERVYAGIGSRYLLTDDIEFDANVTYVDLNNASWTYSGTGLLAVSENVALKADVAIDDDKDVALTGGVRLAM